MISNVNSFATVLISITISIFTLCNCAKREMIFDDVVNVEKIVSIAIYDFLAQNDVSIGNKTYSVKIDTTFERLIGVSILPSDAVISIVGDSSSIYLPNRYLVVDNKLFYWRNSEDKISDDMIYQLKKFEIVRFIKDVQLSHYSDVSELESKSVHYYFCKRNLNTFRKKISEIALGYYKPPYLFCR